MATPNTPPDPLDRILNRLSDTPEPAPDLQREVWRRIAADEARSSVRPSPFFEQFSRPVFAAMFVFSCVVTGLFLAEVRVARLQTETSTRLARSYVQLINPLLQEPVKEADLK
jgi:hypothetical protein